MLANAGAVFSHGSAFDLKKDVLVKLKVIIKQSEFKENKYVFFRSTFARVFENSFFN